MEGVLGWQLKSEVTQTQNQREDVPRAAARHNNPPPGSLRRKTLPACVRLPTVGLSGSQREPIITDQDAGRVCKLGVTYARVGEALGERRAENCLVVLSLKEIIPPPQRMGGGNESVLWCE